ncbi:tRNA (adenosine(37)-N6)-threonylcarbamoyltransferase complex transferase subunit TsaD [Patescibacteria group bacterium]|nr:tRNA (adenosine(37)-N6)-threonylcarbamoyltransferase complex transferase subunit TsaD [Patescibacteria group bacterium]MBU1663029.1 tRNA (adenosine(37)-N6)-threonylcarbamoyltransferase complex transferase subunit TsaD [Patescibacteria group bacterium]MBU1934162.1 tRNA (adenosine(37)-N6)-threonylcarbamoyltransferase complex transferase subunit TsaD [Patescibacteria group bacterium]MBU2007553.1 tRNA (adenosine(37)-N6)-threonylcarbamoyltransferase complex transferase subunit TsaD [Patescibacteri
MIILGIETSCDETAVSVARGAGNNVKALSNVVASQIEIHKKYGGVVPEVAAREHVLNILPVVNEALIKADLASTISLPSTGEKTPRPRHALSKSVDAIAVAVGPGLITSLLVGVETAKTLAYAWRVPVVAINHIEGHIYANWLTPIRNGKCQMTNVKNKIKFPVIILTVSGGHTMLVLMNGHGQYKVLGQTRDDAAGEAFDKAAQLLGLEYPGGPIVAAMAAKLQIGQKLSKLPRPMINDKSFDFSFSGLKTALLYEIQKDKQWEKKIPEYAAEFQQAVTDVLVHKTIKAALKYNCKNIMLSGGVAANQELRKQLGKAVKNKLPYAHLNIPELKYCTDNAAMIAAAGYYRAKRKDFTLWQKLKANANIELTN